MQDPPEQPLVSSDQGPVSPCLVSEPPAVQLSPPAACAEVESVNASLPSEPVVRRNKHGQILCRHDRRLYLCAECVKATHSNPLLFDRNTHLLPPSSPPTVADLTGSPNPAALAATTGRKIEEPNASSKEVVSKTTASAASSAAPLVLKHGFCEHGARKSECKYCGGRSICEHGRRRRQCTACCGSGICHHGKRKGRCRLCNEPFLCPHNQFKNRCSICCLGHKIPPATKHECSLSSPKLSNSVQKERTSVKDVESALATLPQAAVRLFMAFPEAALSASDPSLDVKLPSVTFGSGKVLKTLAPKLFAPKEPKKCKPRSKDTSGSLRPSKPLLLSPKSPQLDQCSATVSQPPHMAAFREARAASVLMLFLFCRPFSSYKSSF
jgi:hypothetical protein